jgi:hypothetical protein
VTGQLVFAKAVLSPEMDYDVLSYASRNPVFPLDSTGDQFFDDGQFSAYLALGRHIGAEAAMALTTRFIPQARRRPPAPAPVRAGRGT